MFKDKERRKVCFRDLTPGKRQICSNTEQEQYQILNWVRIYNWQREKAPNVVTSENETMSRFGIKLPVRKARMLLSGLVLLSVLYFFGGLLFLIPAFFFVSAYGSWGWLLTLLLLSLIIGAIAYRAYQRDRKRLLVNAEKITAEDRPELAGLLQFIERDSERRGLETPDLYIHPDLGSNAFAIGRRNGGNIVLFEGLLTTLESEKELEAVVAHELGHLDNRDSMLMALLAGIKETIVRFWTWFGFGFRKWLYERRGVVLTPTEEQALKHKSRRRSERVCSPIGLCEKSISRHREYIADAEAVESTNPRAVVEALSSLKESDHEPDEIDVAQSLCIHGTHSGILSRLRSTHPPMKKRIQHIERQYLD